MNIGKEKKYKFVITQLENMEYEKKKANEVVKYIFNRPLSRNSEAGTILGSEKQNVSLPVSAPVTARALAPKAVEVEKIRPESTKELREIVSWSKYNRNQVKNLKKNVSMVMRKVETNKKASEKFSIENILKGKEATSPITPFKSPKKIFISKEQSVENRIEMNRKLSDLLKDYPKGNAGITSDKLNCPHFALSNNHNLEEIEKMAKKNPDLKIDAARLEDSKNILQGPNFRDSLTRIDKKLKARALSLGDLTSRATKEQIEKAIVTIVKSNKANKHLRTPSPPKTKDKIFIEFDSALSHRNLKNTTARPALTETEVMKSVQRLNDDLKRISTSCDKYIDNSIKFNGQMKRKVRRIKKSLNKLDRKMLGREYPIDRDIKKQIYKEIDNPTVYLAIKREEKRRRPLVLGLN